ncbi:MAG: S8 family serine peptidase [bacterium]|nr:S8 family serine peptidase [bacterium]
MDANHPTRSIPISLLCLVLGSVWLGACNTRLLDVSPPLDLWQPAMAPSDPAQLRVEPANIVASMGESARLTLAGRAIAGASCLYTGGVIGTLPTIEIKSPLQPGPIDILCHNGELNAHAQVTFVETAELPVTDPYAGGVALFKLRRLKRYLDSPEGTQKLGHYGLDSKLRRLGAWVMPAFPFDRSGMRDYVGIDRWVAIEFPEGVNYYQAVELLRGDREIEHESYTPLDVSFVRVEKTQSWPTELVRPTREARAPVRGSTKYSRIMDVDYSDSASWDLRALGAPEAWTRGQGAGVRIGVVDSGVDINHAALVPNLVSRATERMGQDIDGNGIPGDEHGANLAHLAISRVDGKPRIALGLVNDLSDWDGALSGRPGKHWGHGTKVASLALGAGGMGHRLGTAPRAELLVVDVQENLRRSRSSLGDVDPRMRESGSKAGELRSPLWSRAAGIVYATAEHARVITCAWASDKPSWILHDALLYAEDNCAVPVCAASTAGEYPGKWRRNWLKSLPEPDTGAVYDSWSGVISKDFYRRPLRATLVVDSLDGDFDSADPDLAVLTNQGGHHLQAAVSTPRNDASPTTDRRTGVFSGPDAAAGLTAGAAALITGLRPDLEPWAISAALRRGVDSRGQLSIPAALTIADQEPHGPCEAITMREEIRVADPWWKRVKVKASMRQPGDRDEDSPPASPDR